MNTSETQFDMFRLTKAKKAVDLCANTIRQYATMGLPLYRRGRAVFVSKMELQEFIRNPDTFTKNKPNSKRSTRK